MRKQFSVLMILLSWIISLTAVLLFPDQPKIPSQQASIYTYFDLNGEHSISQAIELTEVPDFKVDQKLFSNFIEELTIGLSTADKALSSLFLYTKGYPLFDIKRLFIHFFYPW
jgi:hypothetical protein